MKIFIKVKCHAYLRKAHDGIRITIYDTADSVCSNKTVADPSYKALVETFDFDKMEYVTLADLSEWDGSGYEKTYRERVEEEFTGVVVGITEVNVKGQIGTDWECDGFGREYGHCYKQITDRQKVAVVYFKNNSKRYVPLEDLEIIEAEIVESEKKK